MRVSASPHSRGASVSMPWVPLSRHFTLACSLTTTVASPLKSTSTSYLPPQSNTGQHVGSGSSASRERAYSSGMPRMATSVNPATNTPATAAVMVTVTVAGAGRGSTGGLEVSQIVSAARDVGVQDVPLLPEPASWKGVRGWGRGGGGAGLGRRRGCRQAHHARAGMALAHCSSVGTSSHSTCERARVSSRGCRGVRHPWQARVYRHSLLQQHGGPHQNKLEAEVLQRRVS
jgi:hypothetical protein